MYSTTTRRGRYHPQHYLHLDGLSTRCIVGAQAMPAQTSMSLSLTLGSGLLALMPRLSCLCSSM